MIEFLEHHFSAIIQTAGIIYVLFGVVLLYYKVPKDKAFAPYRLSQKLLAGSFWLMSCNLFLWLFTFNKDWDKVQPLIECIDLILFYLIGILFSYAFSNLLDRAYLCKRRTLIDLSKWGISSAIAIFSMTDAMEPYRQWLLFVSLLFLLEFFTRYLLYFRKTYLHSSELLDNYFLNDKSSIIRWIRRSIALIFLSGIIGIVSINTGIIINWLYQIYVISANAYVAFSFINYATEYGNLQKAEDCEEVMENEETTEESELVQAEEVPIAKNSKESSFEITLAPRLTAWVESKEYTKEQFNIEELAALLGTNRYYLSKYINDTYSMNFSTWIASLRIKEAKRMMSEQKDVRLEEIAYAVGFSSLSYFSKVFSRLEGSTPSTWLKERSL